MNLTSNTLNLIFMCRHCIIEPPWYRSKRGWESFNRNSYNGFFPVVSRSVHRPRLTNLLYGIFLTRWHESLCPYAVRLHQINFMPYDLSRSHCSFIRYNNTISDEIEQKKSRFDSNITIFRTLMYVRCATKR